MSDTKLCFIDVETTGLFPWKAGIIQIAGIIIINGEEKETFNIMVNPFPEDVIEDAALKANGRDRDTLYKQTPPKEAFEQLESILGKYVKKTDTEDKFFFVGYNVKFDEEFMRKWFTKCGSKFFGSWFFTPSVDVMTLAAVLLMEKRSKMENFKLGTVLRELNIKVEGSLHDADTDIRMTKLVWDKCVG